MFPVPDTSRGGSTKPSDQRAYLVVCCEQVKEIELECVEFANLQLDTLDHIHIIANHSNKSKTSYIPAREFITRS